MNTAERSLRSLVEKWLTPTAATPVRVIRFSRTGASRRRYARVEVQRPEGSVALFSSGTMTAHGTSSRPRPARQAYVLALAPCDWVIAAVCLLYCLISKSRPIFRIFHISKVGRDRFFGHTRESKSR